MGKHKYVPVNDADVFWTAVRNELKPEPVGKHKEEVPPFKQLVYKYFGDSADLLLRKHADYGPKNISWSPGGPLNGLRVRMWDKMARINNLIESGATPENESLKDSFQDLANYSIIAMLVLDDKWPNE